MDNLDTNETDIANSVCPKGDNFLEIRAMKKVVNLTKQFIVFLCH